MEDVKSLEKFIKEYKSEKKASFPSHDLHPDKKKEMRYFKECVEWLFYLGCNGMLYSTGIAAGGSNYGRLRQYSKGQINPNKYKPFLIGTDEDGSVTNKSFINISWRPDNGYLKTLDQMSGAYDKMDYDLEVTAIDPHSDYERNLRSAGMKINASPEFKNLQQMVGVALPKSEDPEFDTEEDVDLYEKAGGLKLKTEIAMQKAINASRQISGWRQLKSMLFNDIRDLGYACVKDYVDHQEMCAMVRYVDPDYLLIPRSKYNDFRDITMAGEVRRMTIAEVRNESNLTETELHQIAVKYGWNAQVAPDVITATRYGNAEGMPYDQTIVWVLDANWLSSDLNVYVEKEIEKYGTLDFRKKDADYRLTEKEQKKGKKALQYRVQYCYKAKWIIGTECCFDYGKEYYQKRTGKPANKKALLPYHIVTIGTLSKLERMIGDIDDINILTYKRRNAIASIPAPPGIIINKSALENVEFDGSIKSPKYLVNMLLQKGFLALDTIDEFNRREQSINEVVSYVSTNLFEQFRIYSEQIEEKRRNIQLATGMNDLVDGSSDNERRLKIEGEAKLEAANNAMQPEYAAMRELIQKAFTNVMYRWQEIAKHEEVELEYTPLDGESVEAIKLTADISRAKFGLKVNLASTYQERQMLLQEIMQLKAQRTQTGQGGIPEEAYLGLYRVIKEGNIPLAQLLIAKARKEAKKADMERSMALQQHNAEVQSQAAQVAEIEKRKSIFAKAAADLILQHSKYQNEAMLKTIEADLQDGALNNEFIRNTVEQLMQGNMPNLSVLQQIIMSGVEQAGMQPQAETEAMVVQE